jgi:hypothetical protein
MRPVACEVAEKGSQSTSVHIRADRVIFVDGCEVVEENPPAEFFTNPRSDRTKLFLARSSATSGQRRILLILLRSAWSAPHK